MWYYLSYVINKALLILSVGSYLSYLVTKFLSYHISKLLILSHLIIKILNLSVKFLSYLILSVRFSLSVSYLSYHIRYLSYLITSSLYPINLLYTSYHYHLITSKLLITMINRLTFSPRMPAPSIVRFLVDGVFFERIRRIVLISSSQSRSISFFPFNRSIICG